MRAIYTTFYLIIYILIAFVSTAFAAEPVVVYPASYPPFFIKDSSSSTSGFSLDILKAVAKKSGLHLKYVAVNNPDTLYRMLKNGQAQIVPETGVTALSRQMLDFTVPFERSDVNIITLAGSSIRNWDDLTGKKTATIKYSQACEMLKENPAVQAICSGSTDTMILDLLSGRTDALILPYGTIEPLVRRLGIQDRVNIVRPPLYVSERALGVVHTSPALYAKLNTAMESFVKTDEYKQIYDKWHPKRSIGLGDLTKMHIIILCGIILGIIILIWRYFSLRRINSGLRELNAKLTSATEALSDAQDMLNSMAEAVDDIIWFVTPDKSKILYVNKAYETVYGKSVQSLYDSPNSYTECIHQEDRNNPDLHINDLSEDTTGRRFRVINQTTGELHWVLSQHHLHKDADGRVDYIIGLTSDITSAVTTEQKLAFDQQVIAQQAKFASIGEMIGAITHQWRQPLNALYLIVQTLEDVCDEDKPDKAQINTYLSESMNLLEHMSDTINDFRDFFRQDKKNEYFDATKTLFQILRMLSPQLKANGISYHVTCTCDMRSFSCTNEFEPGNPSCRTLLYGVPNEFKHAMLTLLQNAKDAMLIKKSASKDIYITMGATNESMTITVRDTAGGISEDMIGRVFDPYVTDKKDGTGMGLYLAKKMIVENMGGSIAAENTDSGARFTVILPVGRVIV